MKGRKEGRRGRKQRKLGEKAKTRIYSFIYLFIFYLIISTTSSRKTWAERQDEDEVENAKGMPARIKL